jgi:hypothetical protein
MRTGRPPLSDEEKKQRGTFDPRWSQEARSERQEDKVVALFGADKLETIPDPPEGLVSQARDEYFLWCRRLHEQGHLSQKWVEKILFYALRKHSTLVRLASGKLPKDGDLKACEMFIKELGALNIDAPRAGQEAPKSKFAHVGFANRVTRSTA